MRMVIVLGFLFVTSESLLPLLLLISVLEFCFSALFEPCRSALIPNLMPNRYRIPIFSLPPF